MNHDKKHSKSDYALFQARIAVERLMARYAENLDNGELDKVAALFNRGCIRVDGQADIMEGEDAVRKMFARFTCFYNEQGERVDISKQQGKPFTKHLNSNLSFETFEEGRIVVRSCFSVLQALPGQNIQTIVAGRYCDTFLCDAAGEWFFKERYEYIDMVGDISRHLALNPF